MTTARDGRGNLGAGIGFGYGDRVFLTDSEHETYLRRMPVRYARRGLAGIPEVCHVCGEPAVDGNPLQAAHRVPFNAGVRRWRLTPTWLDRPGNLRWAHRQRCNRLVELSEKDIEELVELLRRKSP
ncbi:hypothetical protein [Janibacter indicus]|uniref:hypothetical protein n=1 Tax=Janibacter indicus TaxID=857417 RepID=UPI003D9A2DF6